MNESMLANVAKIHDPCSNCPFFGCSSIWNSL